VKEASATSTGARCQRRDFGFRDLIKLYLIRHGAAGGDHPEDEHTNPGLSEKGRSRMMRMVAGLRQMGIQPELILTSPLKRAVETAHLVAQGLGQIAVETLEELSPSSKLQSLVGRLGPHLNLTSLAVVGHQPDLGQLASFLLTGSPTACQIAFKRGGVGLLSGDFSQTPARWSLEWLLTPRVLRRL
jgi:phosphohistidine phosphatase